MGRRSELVEKHTVRVGRANKSEFKVACVHCRGAGIETQFVSRTDAVIRHLNQCQVYQGPLPTIMITERVNGNQHGDYTNPIPPPHANAHSTHNYSGANFVSNGHDSGDTIPMLIYGGSTGGNIHNGEGFSVGETVNSNNSSNSGLPLGEFNNSTSYSRYKRPRRSITADLNSATTVRDEIGSVEISGANKDYSNNSSGHPNKQWVEQMERQILRAIVSTGMPFNAVEDSAFREMIQTLSPNLQTNPDLIPTRASLSGRILMEADSSLKADSLRELGNCKWLTLTVDCWKNCSQRNILGYVLRTPTNRSLVWEWKDVTATVNNDSDGNNNVGVSYESVVTVAQHPDLESKVACTVVTENAQRAFYGTVKELNWSDNSDGQGYRKDDNNSSNNSENPPIATLTLACYDEEIRDMLGDCLLSLPGMREALMFASEVTSVFKGSPDGRNVLQRSKLEGIAANKRNNEEDKGPMVYRQTVDGSNENNGLESEDLENVIEEDPLRLILQYNQFVSRALALINELPQGNSSGNPVVPPSGSVDDSQFLTLIHAACEITGALSDYGSRGNPKLRMVLPAASRLWNALEEATHVAATVSSAIQAAKYALNKRLQSWDLKLLILSTLFDPAIKRSLFNSNVVTTPLIISLCEETYRRLFSEDPSQALVASFLQYLQDDAWPFSDHKYDSASLDSFYWSPLVKSDHPELARLALRLESCVVDAVDPEKLFDDMGRIHSALRTMTSAQKTNNGQGSSMERVHRERNKDPETLAEFLANHEPKFGKCTTLLPFEADRQEFSFETLFANPTTSSSIPLLGDHELPYS